MRIESLDTDLTRDLNILVLDCLSFLPDGMTSLKKIIGLKCTRFSLLLDLVYLSLLVGFRRVFSS